MIGFVSVLFNVPSMRISPGINPKCFELDPMNVVMRPKIILVTIDSITFWLPWCTLLLLLLFLFDFDKIHWTLVKFRMLHMQK